MAGKEAGLRVRVEKDLRDDFINACHSQDRHASDVIREFMRQYARKHFDGRQAGLSFAKYNDTTIHKPETQ